MQPLNPRGRDLKKAEFESAIKVRYDLKAEYGYDAGYAIGRYLLGLREGKILGVRCHRCGRTLVPPRAFCELCFVPIAQWVELSDKGVVNTFSISYVRWDAARLSEPEIPAVIEIEGASPGVGILHVLGEVRPEDVHVGMKVEAVWKPSSERRGAITDILYFRPVRSQGG